MPESSTIKKRLTQLGHDAHFIPRHKMMRVTPINRFHHTAPIPTTPLPVDSTGNAMVSCPMDGNDTLGDCGFAMAAHVDNIWTFGQGKPGFTESVFNLAALEAQYKQVSGGDNGVDEDMMVGSGGAWVVGLANVPAAVVVDHLDIDVTNGPLCQYAIDQFYAVCMAWSVPDAFIDGFNTGTVWPDAGIPDPNNGHYTPLADVGGPADEADGTPLFGFYRLWTWGTWCWVSPAFIASVQPQSFVAFSPRQFSLATGLDSKGRHISTQAAKWVAMGGSASKVAAAVALFPPLNGPVPVPPGPVPPGPVPPPAPPPSPALIETVQLSAVRKNGIVAWRTPVALAAATYGLSLVSADEGHGDDDPFRLPCAVAAQDHATAINWPALLAHVQALIAKWGPAAVPIVQELVDASNLTPTQKAVIDAILATLGSPVASGRR
jgi:hypothetical protein